MELKSLFKINILSPLLLPGYYCLSDFAFQRTSEMESDYEMLCKCIDEEVVTVDDSSLHKKPTKPTLPSDSDGTEAPNSGCITPLMFKLLNFGP